MAFESLDDAMFWHGALTGYMAGVKSACKEEDKSSLLLRMADTQAKLEFMEAENDRLREQIERLQPKDCEGNVLDIADTVSMLRSEYDGDHEWDDVVTELVLTKWGGDRWIVRGSKGEAWACDCIKTGYDEDAYESSDDVEPIDSPTLVEAENAKLRKFASQLMRCIDPTEHQASCNIECPAHSICEDDRHCRFYVWANRRAEELGIEVD